MTARNASPALSTPAWTLAALAASVESGSSPPSTSRARSGELAERTGLPVAVVDALVEVLATMELAERIGEHWVAGASSSRSMREPQLGLLRDDLRRPCCRASPSSRRRGVEPHALGGWRHTDEELLQAQGRLSASVIPLLAHVLFPHVPGLLDRLGSESGAFLDVGAGVAAVSIAMCRQYPAIRAVGLEPASAPLELARRNIAAAGLRNASSCATSASRSSPRRGRSTWPGCPRASSPPTPRHRAADRPPRAAPGGLLLTGTLDRAARMPRRPSPGCAWRCGAARRRPRRDRRDDRSAGLRGRHRGARQSGRLVPVHARRRG